MRSECDANDEISHPPDSDGLLSDPPQLTDSFTGSDAGSSTDSEYERYCNTIEINADIADTHESNQELQQKDAVKNFFRDIKNLDSLENSDQREWIGSLPSNMFDNPVPLFIDHDTETDYQLHFSYTKMKAIPTSSKAKAGEDDIPDYYTHCLSSMSKRKEIELVGIPDIVIPLGRLFINRAGHSDWTGYEIFVDSNMAVWMIYALDVDGFERWDSVDCSLLSGRTVLGGTREGTVRERATSSIACFWPSLKRLESANFEDAAELARATRREVFESSFVLLETSTFEVSQAFSSTTKFAHKILETSKLRINPYSRAGQQLLSLAALVPERHILKLKFEDQAQTEFRDDMTLMRLAMRYEDEYIINILDDLGYRVADYEPLDHESTF